VAKIFKGRDMSLLYSQVSNTHTVCIPLQVASCCNWLCAPLQVGKNGYGLQRLAHELAAHTVSITHTMGVFLTYPFRTVGQVECRTAQAEDSAGCSGFRAEQNLYVVVGKASD